MVGSIALVQQNKQDANDKGTVLHLFTISQFNNLRFPLEESINVTSANGDALGAGNMYVNAYAGSVPAGAQNVTVGTCILPLRSVMEASQSSRLLCVCSGSGAVDLHQQAGPNRLRRNRLA